MTWSRLPSSSLQLPSIGRPFHPWKYPTNLSVLLTRFSVAVLHHLSLPECSSHRNVGDVQLPNISQASRAQSMDLPHGLSGCRCRSPGVAQHGAHAAHGAAHGASGDREDSMTPGSAMVQLKDHMKKSALANGLKKLRHQKRKMQMVGLSLCIVLVY